MISWNLALDSSSEISGRFSTLLFSSLLILKSAVSISPNFPTVIPDPAAASSMETPPEICANCSSRSASDTSKPSFFASRSSRCRSVSWSMTVPRICAIASGTCSGGIICPFASKYLSTTESTSARNTAGSLSTITETELSATAATGSATAAFSTSAAGTSPPATGTSASACSVAGVLESEQPENAVAAIATKIPMKNLLALIVCLLIYGLFTYLF